LNALIHPAVAMAIRRAWLDSHAAVPTSRHEEGGYIVQNSDGSYGVDRWPRGERSQIVPPPLDPDNRYNGRIVMAAFHTHPNPPVDESGSIWDQRPSESDRRWHVRRKLRGIVVSGEVVFEIDLDGTVSVLGKRLEMF
jgi:hypothetical protein